MGALRRAHESADAATAAAAAVAEVGRRARGRRLLLFIHLFIYWGGWEVCRGAKLELGPHCHMKREGAVHSSGQIQWSNPVVKSSGQIQWSDSSRFLTAHLTAPGCASNRRRATVRQSGRPTARRDWPSDQI